MSRILAVRTALLAVCIAPLIAAVGRADTAPQDGKALFHEKCQMCHGTVGMGTGLLARRVQPAELTKRTNLTADQVISLARLGVGNMPAISRGEVSDAQMRAIADYLATGPEAGR